MPKTPPKRSNKQPPSNLRGGRRVGAGRKPTPNAEGDFTQFRASLRKLIGSYVDTRQVGMAIDTLNTDKWTAPRNAVARLARVLGVSPRTIQMWQQVDRKAARSGVNATLPPIRPSWKQAVDLAAAFASQFGTETNAEAERWIKMIGCTTDDGKAVALDDINSHLLGRKSFMSDAEGMFNQMVKRLDNVGFSWLQALIGASAYFTQIGFAAAYAQFMEKIKARDRSKCRMAIFWSADSFAFPPNAPASGRRATNEFLESYLRKTETSPGKAAVNVVIRVFLVHADGISEQSLREYVTNDYEPAASGSAVEFWLLNPRANSELRIEHLADTYLLYTDPNDDRSRSFMAVVTEPEPKIGKILAELQSSRKAGQIGNPTHPYLFTSQVSRVGWDAAHRYLAHRKIAENSGDLTIASSVWTALQVNSNRCWRPRVATEQK